MTRLSAVILAAGASTRMGRPKALLEWRGRPFVLHTVELAREAGAEPIVVVQGAVTLPAEAVGDATVVHNAQWSRGPLGSLQCGLAAVREHAPTAAVMVLTVDRPHIAASTVQALAAAAAGEPAAIWQPRWGDRRGHPILYPPDVVQRLLDLRPPSTPRDLLGEPSIAQRRRQIDVSDPAVLDNLDSPADLHALPR